MIRPAKEFLKRHWPALRLRWILLAVLLFAAARPAVGAVGLRVYENSLVRQTEAELAAQAVALTATAAALWPGAQPAPVVNRPQDYQPYRSSIDLSDGDILPQRPWVRASGRRRCRAT